MTRHSSRVATAADGIAARSGLLPAPELQALLGGVELLALARGRLVPGVSVGGARGGRLQLSCHRVQVCLAALKRGRKLAQPALLILQLDLARAQHRVQLLDRLGAVVLAAEQALFALLGAVIARQL